MLYSKDLIIELKLTPVNNCLTNIDTRIDLCYFSRAFSGSIIEK